MAYIVIAYIVMAYIVMAYIVIACIVMAYIGMAKSQVLVIDEVLDMRLSGVHARLTPLKSTTVKQLPAKFILSEVGGYSVDMLWTDSDGMHQSCALLRSFNLSCSSKDGYFQQVWQRAKSYIVMAYIVMAHIVMAYIVGYFRQVWQRAKSCTVMAYIVMAYIVMAYIVGYFRQGQICVKRCESDYIAKSDECEAKASSNAKIIIGAVLGGFALIALGIGAWYSRKNRESLLALLKSFLLNEAYLLVGSVLEILDYVSTPRMISPCHRHWQFVCLLMCVHESMKCHRRCDGIQRRYDEQV